MTACPPGSFQVRTPPLDAPYDCTLQLSQPQPLEPDIEFQCETAFALTTVSLHAERPSLLSSTPFCICAPVGGIFFHLSSPCRTAAQLSNQS